MANLCSTDVTLNGPKKDIDVIEDIFNRAAKSSRRIIAANNGIDFWVGMLLTVGLGMSEKEVDDKYETRGYVFYYNRTSDTEFEFSQDDKWSPQLEAIGAVVNDLGLNVSIEYTAIEPGCEIFITNGDKAGKYLIDVWDPDEVPDQFAEYDYDFVEPQELFNAICEWRGIDIEYSEENLEKLLHEMWNSNEEMFDHMSIHLMEYEALWV